MGNAHHAAVAGTCQDKALEHGAMGSRKLPAQPSPSEAVEVPPEKTDIPITSTVVISVAPSRLKEAPRPRRFLDGR